MSRIGDTERIMFSIFVRNHRQLSKIKLLLFVMLFLTAELCGEQLPVRTYTTADGMGWHVTPSTAFGMIRMVICGSAPKRAFRATTATNSRTIRPKKVSPAEESTTYWKLELAFTGSRPIEVCAASIQMVFRHRVRI